MVRSLGADVAGGAFTSPTRTRLVLAQEAFHDELELEFLQVIDPEAAAALEAQAQAKYPKK